VGSERVARLFDHRAIAFVQQHAGQKRKRLLRAVDDDHIVDITDHTASPAKVACDLRSKFGQTMGSRVLALHMGGGKRQRTRPGIEQPHACHGLAVLQIDLQFFAATCQRQRRQAAQARCVAG
jgi:hypothetical protein